MRRVSQYGRLLTYAWRQWPFLLWIFVLTIVTSMAAALGPWPLKILVDYALGDTEVPGAITSLFQSISINPTPVALIISAALAGLVLFAINSALGVGLSIAWTIGGQRMVYDLAADLFHRLQRLSLLFHSRRHLGDSLSRLTGDTWCIYTVIDGLLMSPGQQVFTLVAMGGIAWTLDPALALLSLIVAPLLGLSSLYFGHRLKRRAKRSREAKSRLLSLVHQTFTAIPVVQVFGTESRNTKHFRTAGEQAVALVQRGSLVKGTFGLVNGLITAMGTALILYGGGSRVLSGAISLGTMLVFVKYMRAMQKASRKLFKTFATLKTAEASLDRVMEIFESAEHITDEPGALRFPKSTNGDFVKLSENVTFGYERDKPVLNDICLGVEPGEMVALVGPTGAGKSTLMSLVPRFLDPWEGRVLLNGLNIRRIRLSELRSSISIVLQEPFLLPLTIGENIAYGRPTADREDIIRAATAAQAHDFICQLPQRYDTVLGERGVTLSGGERQRLAIARALLKDAPVLLLDEPTSSLDAGTESLLMGALDRLLAGRTALIIAHRLSTVRRADRIVVLGEGQIEEVGTHDELLAACGYYSGLIANQASIQGATI